VKAYLVQHGIAEARVQTISYGEERPMAQGADENAYQQNRRAEFDITSVRRRSASHDTRAPGGFADIDSSWRLSRLQG
jgi:hypothetical protein